MKYSILKKIFFTLVVISVEGCGLFTTIVPPNLQQEQKDRFLEATGHELTRIYEKEDKLGYIFDNGVYVKKVWGGNKVVSSAGQTIKLTYTKESFDKLKLFLGNDFSVGPQLSTIHYMTVTLEDIQRHELVDFQPLIEYMGEDSLGILQKEFIVSMIKVTKFTVRAYEKVAGELGAVYQPYPMVKVKAETGSSTSREDEYVGYNVFIGYKLYNGKQWWNSNFESVPKINISILKPEVDSTITQVRTRLKGRIPEYNTLEEKHKNQMRLYLMTRDEYKDDWLLQSKATINIDGQFEGILKLGTLEEGNGHRYSIAAFVTYFDLNREVNSSIPHLPFNKGKFVIQVKREDDF